MNKHLYLPKSFEYYKGNEIVYSYECKYCTRSIGAQVDITDMEWYDAECKGNSNNVSTFKEDIKKHYDCSSFNMGIMEKVQLYINSLIYKMKEVFNENILRCKEFCSRNRKNVEHLFLQLKTFLSR